MKQSKHIMQKLMFHFQDHSKIDFIFCESPEQ